MDAHISEINGNGINQNTQKKEIKTKYVHTFTKPIKYEDREYSSLTFDWGKLTGGDALQIENELQSLGIMFVSPEFSGEYLIRMATRACNEKIGNDIFTTMPLYDFITIRNKARSFLLRQGQ